MLFGVIGGVGAGLLILFVGDKIDREPAPTNTIANPTANMAISSLPSSANPAIASQLSPPSPNLPKLYIHLLPVANNP